jgi:hypothetical protein
MFEPAEVRFILRLFLEGHQLVNVEGQSNPSGVETDNA